MRVYIKYTLRVDNNLNIYNEIYDIFKKLVSYVSEYDSVFDGLYQYIIMYVSVCVS